ncbi:hypothetical protein VNO80_05723 [Phaseolus coccineus]|uniref:Uncharacterized protein n=1 Tax=Phaseolus coccineus TaxID=3886 RepID=A0AAN9NFK6_PHACN
MTESGFWAVLKRKRLDSFSAASCVKAQLLVRRWRIIVFMASEWSSATASTAHGSPNRNQRQKKASLQLKPHD